MNRFGLNRYTVRLRIDDALNRTLLPVMAVIDAPVRGTRASTAVLQSLVD
jgi:hypothetical protein